MSSQREIFLAYVSRATSACFFYIASISPRPASQFFTQFYNSSKLLCSDWSPKHLSFKQLLWLVRISPIPAYYLRVQSVNLNLNVLIRFSVSKSLISSVIIIILIIILRWLKQKNNNLISRLRCYMVLSLDWTQSRIMRHCLTGARMSVGLSSQLLTVSWPTLSLTIKKKHMLANCSKYSSK